MSGKWRDVRLGTAAAAIGVVMAGLWKGSCVAERREDDHDFEVFTHQKWSELHRSHGDDLTVHWPDGRSTKGLQKHIEDLKTMFAWAPDTRIREHPVRIGQGEWTAVMGFMEGTFTRPMPIGDGKTIPPTGKAYRIRMSTIGHWNSNGVMDEEYLFWDNQELMKQIGLGQ